MTKKIIYRLLALGFIVSLLGISGSYPNHDVEALTTKTFCETFNSSMSSNSTTGNGLKTSGCTNKTNGGVITFNFDYSYRVTGISSGADGY